MNRFRLTPTQILIFNLLMASGTVSVQTRGLGLISKDNLRVQIHKMRKKLEPHGVEIVTRHGFGWCLMLETKARVRAMIEEVAA